MYCCGDGASVWGLPQCLCVSVFVSPILHYKYPPRSSPPRHVSLTLVAPTSATCCSVGLCGALCLHMYAVTVWEITRKRQYHVTACQRAGWVVTRTDTCANPTHMQIAACLVESGYFASRPLVANQKKITHLKRKRTGQRSFKLRSVPYFTSTQTCMQKAFFFARVVSSIR